MMVWLLLACSGAPTKMADTAEGAGQTDSSLTDTATTAETNCDESWDAWANGFFTTYCRACHSQSSANRFDAPVGVDFDDRSDTVARLEQVRIWVLENQTMPVGGGVPEEELTRLDSWLQCYEANP